MPYRPALVGKARLAGEATAPGRIHNVAGFAILDVPIDSSGTGRGEERGPAAIRAAGLVSRLRARYAGEVDSRIRDTRRDRDTGVVGAAEVRRASRGIAPRVREVLDARERPLVLGGDCTLLLGVFQALPRGSGLWFVDGHADFFDGDSSPTGEAADMDLAELYAPCSIVEVLVSEAIGLCARGHGAHAAAAGETRLGGRIPIPVTWPAETAT